ncbi:replication factor C large subunit [Corchorus olitorius]|uniref:Replication factor C large subunit n=1 Tax=Corchorus olitorius TaxID=93759 RepID=A0A1R3JZD8_9ROSI|nr:replication factor C large subunit [Corchorus olitorius]
MTKTPLASVPAKKITPEFRRCCARRGLSCVSRNVTNIILFEALKAPLTSP